MILVDAHVHIHHGVELGAVLACAATNFGVAEEDLSETRGRPGQRVLCLTETEAARAFQAMSEMAASDISDKSGWRFTATSERESLRASHAEHGDLFVVAGRQIVTAERLEVLALGTSRFIPDGRIATDVIHEAQEQGALAVLPWGFGKWTGRRRKELRRLLEEAFEQPIFLGDNSARLRYLKQPQPFTQSGERRQMILPGSDPLPIFSEFRRVGSFGFAVSGSVSDNTPFADLKRKLIERDGTVRPYGRLEGLFRFLRNQAAMQVRVRLGFR